MTRSMVGMLGAVLLVAGCTTGPHELDIRVENRSAVDFAAVDIHFPDEEVGYGALPAGAVSSFRTVDRAYRYAGVSVRTVAGDTLRLVPVDYVGEERLGSGRYTYVLDVVDGALSLHLLR